MAGVLATLTAMAQLDPEKRDLIQLGYNQPLQGVGPLGAYAFYYHNQPEFMTTNMSLRLAVAPVYMDSELGFRNALGEHTDLGIGAAGGGFADSYYEMRRGRYFREESFDGHGGEISGSVYHLFNPDQMIPLYGIFRASPNFTVYEDNDKTDPRFTLPDDHMGVNWRTGLRWGGMEPVVHPDMAMELSTWYEGRLRDRSGSYGYDGDREMEMVTHLFWARALIAYTLPESKQSFSLSVTAGTSVNEDRLSAYRLGGDLPLTSEFPLILPGYYYQEISARDFVNITGQYSLPLDAAKRFNLVTMGSIAFVDYTPGTAQPNSMNSGVGGGIEYRSRSGVWNILAGYGYGFQAYRSGGDRGGQSIGILCQINLEAQRRNNLIRDQNSTMKSGGLTRFIHSIF
jgi:hypothetical protein